MKVPRSDDPPHRGAIRLPFQRLLSASLFVLVLIAVAGFVSLSLNNAGVSKSVSANGANTPDAGGMQHEPLPNQSGTATLQIQWSDGLSLPTASGHNTQLQPAGSDQYLVWAEGATKQDGYGSEEGTIDIEGIDLKTSSTFTVTDTSDDQYAPAISGSTVVWIDAGSQTKGNEIGSYSIQGKDLASGKTFTVITGALTLDNLSIAGNKVAWVQADETTRRIMLKDLRGGPPALIYAVPREVTSALLEPRISSDYVVWKNKSPTSDPNVYDLRAFDLRTARVKTLVQKNPPRGLPLSDLRFDVWEHYLIWQSPYLEFLDMNTGEQVTLDPEYIQAVAIQGETVVWTVDNGAGSELRGLKLSNRQPRLLQRPGHYRSLTIAGKWVAGTNNPENRLLVTANLDNLFANSVAPIPTIPPPPPTAPGGLPAISGVSTQGPDITATFYSTPQP